MAHLGCPSCGNTDNLHTIERLRGTCHGTFTDTDGEREFEGNGYTEVDWDSSTSIGVECHDCGWFHEGEDDYLDVLRSYRRVRQ